MRRILSILLIIALSVSAFLLPGCTEQAHEHVYSDQWSSNAESHWHVSTCEHAGLMADKASHSFDEGVYHAASFEANGYTVYTCSVCGYEKKLEHNDRLEHSYDSEWSFDDSLHWHGCLDAGFEDLRKDEQPHTEDNEEILKEVTDTETGLARYTCAVCGHTYEKVLLIPASVVANPTVGEGTYYVGQTLADVPLTGGQGSVAGSFAWKDPSQKLTKDNTYTAVFIPESKQYAVVELELSVNAVQLTVTVTTGQHGSAQPMGETAVDYGGTLTVCFAPDMGYAVDTLAVDGVTVNAASRYVFENITADHTIHAEFAESKDALNIQCLEGTPGSYTVSGNTITFSNVIADSIYAISGTFNGNIVIDVGDAYKFELELRGLHISCDYASPIVILGGDKVTLTAKKDYENTVTDLREAVDSELSGVYSGAIHAKCDLEIGGKGKLTVVSKNNNGIRTKDDLEIKNLTLSVTCTDNALKGDDSVTIKSGIIELIATMGDGIKTVNTDISSKGKQRGIVTISGGTVTIYAACDGIDAAYDVVINETTATVVINIYTDKYSDYSQQTAGGQSGAAAYAAFRPGRPGFPGDQGGMGGMGGGNPDKGAYSTKGIKAGNIVSISGGKVNITSYDDGIHAGQTELLGNGATAAGEILLSGGELTIKSNDDGVHADGILRVQGGSVKVTGSYEGLEGNHVIVTAGSTSVTSTDDGLNATGSSAQAIMIGGGTLYVFAGGDGVDSNSTASYNGILISGGQSVIICNSGGNSAIDSERGYQYTGGSVLALTGGSGGMGGMGGGMAGESYNCSNFTSIGTKSTVSLSAQQYLTVTVGSDTVLTVQIPVRMSATAVYLGSNSAKFSYNVTSPQSQDTNGVWWN